MIKFSFKRGDIEYTIEVSDEDTWEYEIEEEENVCETCERSFKSPASLKQHMTVMEHNDG